jgi:Tfp pilus assembly protein PilF
MLRQALAIACLVLGLTGCAALPEAPSRNEPPPWADAAFAWDPALVTVARDDLFRLPPALLDQLQSPGVRDGAPSQRLKHLLALIFGDDLRGFSYQAGHSTPAAQTWERKRGDCLSLTVLTYSAARALGMPAQMQEVQVPVLFDRRGGLDVVNGHVNVIFARAQRGLLEDAQPRDVVIDFEPEFASSRRGKALSEDAILARYYNNIAVEHLARHQRTLAYAYFKAAVLADAGYGGAYTNLSVLYAEAGLHRDAEQLLQHAIALGDPADVALRSLHQLLVQQGRHAEAKGYARMLEARRASDPYHWIGLGVDRMQAGDARGAVRALERARSIAVGFPEVHRLLAIAYWRAGDRGRAQDELTLLASLDAGEAQASVLRKKFDAKSRLP